MKHLIIATFFFISSVKAQEKLSAYKLIADKKIKESINIQPNNSLTISTIFLMTDTLGKGKFWKYSQKKNAKVVFLKAIFTYKLYKSDLSFGFPLTVTVTKTGTVIIDSSHLSYLPPCVIKNTRCNLISKDSALNIAKRDSFLFNHFTVELTKEHRKNNFFWYFVAKPSQSFSSKSETEDSIPCRVIDAVTGSIISRKRSWRPSQ